jgi:NAD(P)H-hydrate epimerase
VNLPAIPRRTPDAHKGSVGRVLVVAGSVGLSGAAWLSAKSALRTGAGVVVTACPDAVQPILAAKHTCVMVRPFPSTPTGGLAFAALEPLRALARDFDAVAIGPGLGRHPSTLELVRRLATALPADVKLVLDADALNAFAEQPARLDAIRSPFVLTPHPGELSRLLGTTGAEIQKDRRAAALRYTASHPGVLVLKGQGTLVAHGTQVHVNDTGNSGMATAGSGDVLTGVVAALLAGGLDAWDAARLGTWIHGRAGDVASAAIRAGAGVASAQPVPLVATDVLERLPEVVARELARTAGGSA